MPELILLRSDQRLLCICYCLLRRVAVAVGGRRTAAEGYEREGGGADSLSQTCSEGSNVFVRAQFDAHVILRSDR